MSAERIVGLIHAELDGSLPEADRAELEQALADPELRRLRDDLHQVAAGLEALPELEPPEALRRALRDSIPAHRPTAERRPGGLGEWLRATFGRPATLRLAGAFAAGLAVGAVFVNVGSGLSDGQDLSALTGTMSRYQAGEDDAVDRLRMDVPGIAGTVGLHQRGALYVIEYDLNADQPVEVVTDYTGSDASFAGFAHIGDANTRAVAEGRRVWLTVDGHRQYAVFLSRPRADAGDIQIGFYDGDRLLHRGNLKVPAGAQAR